MIRAIGRQVLARWCRLSRGALLLHRLGKVASDGRHHGILWGLANGPQRVHPPSQGSWLSRRLEEEIVSKPKPRIAIVGLGMIGGSLGLRLQETEIASEVMGHDADPSQSSRAKQMGAVTKTSFNLVSACEDADLVLLATPLEGIRPTLEAIGPYLREGCVVMDTATLKMPVMQWAEELLPAGVHFVGGNPILRGGAEGYGLDAASSELFVGGLFCLTPPAEAEPAYRTLLEHSRDNLVRWLDAYVERLQGLRQLLDEDDLGALEEVYRTAVGRRGRWLEARAKGDWGDQPDMELPERPSIMEGLLGTFWRRNRGQ
jgi:prephenate dehydrogenase